MRTEMTKEMVTNKMTVQKLVMTALMMCLIMTMTFIIRIPVPATQGYVHLGDAMIFMAVLLLGWKLGAVAAGIGSALADLWGGYLMYVPVTLVVKAFMAAAVGICIDCALRHGVGHVAFRVFEGLGMVVGGVVMCAGYYLAESLIFGNWATPLAAIPMNILQFLVGVGLATALATAIYKTPAGKRFAYSPESIQPLRNK